MIFSFLFCFLIYTVTVTSFSLNADSNPVVVGYMPEYRIHKIWGPKSYQAYSQQWRAICPKLTHLILFSAEVSSEGKIMYFQKRFSKHLMRNLRKYCPKTKILLALGGHGRSYGFSKLVANSESRKRLITELSILIKKYNLNGVDFNWEFPRNEKEWKNLFELLKLGSKEFMVTMAFRLGQEDILVQHQAAEYVDMFHLMCYDQFDKYGKHSTYELSKKCISKIIKSGLPSQKVTLGLPFYGRQISNQNNAKTYAEIYEMSKNSNFNINLDIINGFYFNGVKTVRKKVLLAIQNKFKGVMIWEVGQDVPLWSERIFPTRNKEVSLLNAIHDEIQSYKENN